jgi:hypothetical protein
MTTKYLEYLHGYDTHLFDIGNVSVNAKLVVDTYAPSNTHHVADVEDYIIAAVDIITGDDWIKLGVGELVDKCKARLLEGIRLDPELIKSQIDGLIADEDKREKLKAAIDIPEGDYTRDMWRELIENGAKFLVTEFTSKGVLMFCEEL